MSSHLHSTNELGLRELSADELQAFGGGTNFDELKAMMQSVAQIYGALTNILDSMNDSSKNTLRNLRG